MRDRLEEAEGTLAAIRRGEVDALVVSGPRGEQTRAIEGAPHPYVVLLNAMGDGAVLLGADGVILFCNRSFAGIVGRTVAAVRGRRLQRLVAANERDAMDTFLREGMCANVARDFQLVTARSATTPVSIAVSQLPLLPGPRSARANGADGTVLMAIISDLTYRKSVETTRAGLLARLMSAEDDERRRIARELHDETGQSLTALLVGLRTIADIAVASDVRRIALQLRQVAAQTVDDVGRLARGLHPAVLDDGGLGAAARRYVEDYARSFGMQLEFAAEEVDVPRLTSLTAATMYRILQETLTNVVRHARATTVTVSLSRTRAALTLLVRDDGAGFDARLVQATARGLGLRGMRERVTLLGGSIDIESAPGHGTVVRAQIPFAVTTIVARKKAPARRRPVPRS